GRDVRAGRGAGHAPDSRGRRGAGRGGCRRLAAPGGACGRRRRRAGAALGVVMKEPAPHKPLRLWPGVVVAAIVIVVGYLTPIVVPAQALLMFFAPIIGALLILLWWLLFSRARWYERVGAIGIIAAAAVLQK